MHQILTKTPLLDADEHPSCDTASLCNRVLRCFGVYPELYLVFSLEQELIQWRRHFTVRAIQNWVVFRAVPPWTYNILVKGTNPKMRNDIAIF